MAATALPERCPACEYSLAGAPVPMCPECGYTPTPEDCRDDVRRRVFLEITGWMQGAVGAIAIVMVLTLGLAVVLMIGMGAASWWGIGRELNRLHARVIRRAWLLCLPVLWLPLAAPLVFDWLSLYTLLFDWTTTLGYAGFGLLAIAVWLILWRKVPRAAGVPEKLRRGGRVQSMAIVAGLHLLLAGAAIGAIILLECLERLAPGWYDAF